MPATPLYERHIASLVENRVQTRPITLITGSRQVGKSTLAATFKNRGYGFVTFDHSGVRAQARKADNEFLSLNPYPLIIDECQRAPEIFISLKKEVDAVALEGKDNAGMFILTGSHVFELVKNVSESMAGRVSILKMSPLSKSEIERRDVFAFGFDPTTYADRAKDKPLNYDGISNLIFRGGYPELWKRPSLSPTDYYQDYKETYLKRDIHDIVQLRNDENFNLFLEVLASFTGQELVLDSISKAVRVDSKTIQQWISVLIACGIVFTVQPYNDSSIVKRVVRRPKLYFTDTGLACSLLSIDSVKTLRSSFLFGALFETYVVNEIFKSYRNRGIEPSLYYYRDKSQDEIDLVLVENGQLHPIEIKSGMTVSNRDIKAFRNLDGLRLPLGKGAVICMTETPYPLDDDNWALPLAAF